MSQRVCDLYNDREFEDLLQEALGKASSDWENDFVSDMVDKFNEHRNDMFLSDLQDDHLNRIANK